MSAAGLGWGSVCVWRLGGSAGAVLQRAPAFPLACTAALHVARTGARLDAPDYAAQACTYICRKPVAWTSLHWQVVSEAVPTCVWLSEGAVVRLYEQCGKLALPSTLGA